MSSGMELLLEIEADFAELKREFTLFLNDIVKIEPYELKESLIRKVRRLRNIGNLRTEEQFRANNINAKITSHLALWERQLEKKYSGKGQRPKPKKRVAKPSVLEAPKNKSVVISDSGAQRERVVELYDEYTRLNLILGARKMINFSKFQNFINSQTRKIQNAKAVDKVRYEVLVHDQKVVIKSKSIKKKKNVEG